jgi:hypothetical protein
MHLLERLGKLRESVNDTHDYSVLSGDLIRALQDQVSKLSSMSWQSFINYVQQNVLGELKDFKHLKFAKALDKKLTSYPEKPGDKVLRQILKDVYNYIEKHYPSNPNEYDY